MKRSQIEKYLYSDGQKLFELSKQIKLENIGNKVFLRGLIEYSNRCSKNCFYCGIRQSNKHIQRYQIDDNTVIDLTLFAWKKGLGSIVLQSGEQKSKTFSLKIEKLLKKIMKLTNSDLGITLSLGEQEQDTYQRWKDAGAKRYLLRIETSNQELYKKLHPENHSYEKRIDSINKSLERLRIL